MISLGFLDRLWDLIERIQAWLTWGGIALAAVASLLFLGAWAVTILRRPQAADTASWASKGLAYAALGGAYGAVVLTLGAAVTLFVPVLGGLTLRAFAAAILCAAVAWILAILTLVMGASAPSLHRARRALLLAGTPWYCLAAYLATLL